MKHYKSPNGTFHGISEGSTVPQGYIEVTIADIESENEAKRQAELEAMPYGNKRRLEYPDIGEQLDALFHAGVFPAEMAAQIQAVKDKYPKEGS